LPSWKDPDLAAGMPGIVDRIAKLTIRGKTRRHYSFATKYCSWHQPDKYPIYDSLVERLLWAYRKEHTFADFRRSDLQDYQIKELDKFLWYTSKDLGV